MVVVPSCDNSLSFSLHLYKMWRSHPQYQQLVGQNPDLTLVVQIIDSWDYWVG